jgi:hypothetical protein
MIVSSNTLSWNKFPLFAKTISFCCQLSGVSCFYHWKHIKLLHGFLFQGMGYVFHSSKPLLESLSVI